MNADSPIAAYVVPDRRPQAAAGLRIVFWAYLANLAVSLLFMAVYPIVTSVLTSASSSNFETVFRALNTVQTLVHLGVVSVLAFGFSRLGTAIEGRARVAVLAAAGTIGFRAVLSLGSLALQLAEIERGWLGPVLSGVFAVFALLTSSLVIVALFGSARALGVSAPLAALVPAGVCVAGATVLDVMNLASWMHLPWDQRPGMWIYYLQSAIDLIAMTLFAAAAGLLRSRVAHQIGATAVTGSAQRRNSDAAWNDAATGVSLIRSGLIGRIVVVVMAVPIVALAAASRELELLAVVGGIAGLGLLIVAVIGVVGQVLYARRVPASAGAGDLAGMSLAFTALSVIFDLWTAVLVVRMTSGGYSSAGDFRDQSPWTTTGSALLALVALALLLASFGLSAKALGRAALAERVRSIGAMIVGSGAAIVLVQVIVAIEPDAAAVGIVLLVPGVVALIGFFRYLAFLSELATAMREGELERPADVPGPLAMPAR